MLIAHINNWLGSAADTKSAEFNGVVCYPFTVRRCGNYPLVLH